MVVTWTTLAQQDLKRIHSYIARNNPTAARKVVSRVYNAVHTQLIAAPLSGRVGRIANTRELVFGDVPYIAAYQIVEGKLQILRVLHTSLRWPE